jgi:hypothetical protein
MGEYGSHIVATYSEEMLRSLLVSLLHDLVVPRIQPVLDEINENGSWAILRVAE